MKTSKRPASKSRNDSNSKNHYRTKRTGFWGGFFLGFFPNFYSVPIRSNLEEILCKGDTFAEDQKRIGRDMHIAMNLVSKELNNHFR